MTENIIGFLRYPPEMRFTASAKALCTFTIYDSESGKYQTKDNIVTWESLAEACNQLLNENSKVFIKGKRNTRKFTNHEGKTKTYEQVTAYRVFELNNTPEEMTTAKEVR